MSRFAVFCGPEPFTGRRVQISDPTHHVQAAVPDRIPLSEFSVRDGINYSYPHDEDDDPPPGYDPPTVASYRLITWRWDGTIDENGDYRFRTGEDA